MPSASPRPCNHAGCREYQSHKGYCAQHQKDRQQYDQHRGNSSERGYNWAWRKYRTGFLRSHPLCAACMRDHRITAATVVDHVVPHKGDQALFWAPANHQSLCKPCHDRKTRTEDMGAWGGGAKV